MNSMRTVHAVRRRDFGLELNTKSKTFRAHFSLPARYKDWSGMKDFRFRIDLAKMTTIYHPDLDNSCCSLAIPLSLPPQYFFKNEDVQKTLPTDTKTWSLQDTWYRSTDVAENFFVSYAKNDVLPLVAISHLGFADEFGPKSKICLQLAEMHSQAVDFPKTGEPVKWDRRFQPRKWPHFMEKKNSYRSKKALGRIFDKVCRQSAGFRPDWVDEFDQRVLGCFKLDNGMLKAARKIKSQYDTCVHRILTQHNVGTEFELWTSFAISKPAVGSDYKRQEHLGKEYDTLKQPFREICYEAAGGRSGDKIDPFVAAVYKVTEEQIKIAFFEHNQGPVNEGGQITGPRKLEARSMPLVTSPWIFHWAMNPCRAGRQVQW